MGNDYRPYHRYFVSCGSCFSCYCFSNGCIVVGFALNMILDYNSANKCFTLQVPEFGEAHRIMIEHGLDLSTHRIGTDYVLFTREPYAALAWYDQGTPAAQHILSSLQKSFMASRVVGSTRHFDVPPDKALWPFQKGSVGYALDRFHNGKARIALCDEPGLGKTEEAIVFASTTRAERILCVVPASVREQWAERVRRWSTIKPQPTISVISAAKRGVPPSSLINWTIISYDLTRVPSIFAALMENKYDLLVLDECHYLKTGDTHRTRAIFGSHGHKRVEGLAGNCASILALSGTPLPNRPAEAYPIARGLCFDSIDWMSEKAFATRFNKRTLNTRPDGSLYVEETQGRHAELQARLRCNFMTRHLKREVMNDLQYPVYDLIHVSETGAVKSALAAERLLDIDPGDLSGADARILGAVATARLNMGVALAPQVADYVADLIEGGEEKITLFAWHVEVLNILQKALDRYGLVRVDGSTTSAQKVSHVRQFIEDPATRVIVGNILSLGTGTDGLQRVCNHALIAEPDWTPGNNVQCFDRLDRGGQRRQVFGEIFVAPGSFAERVLATALRKMNTIHQSLDAR